jgi:hypothetical protein
MSYAVVVARYNENIDWLKIFDASSQFRDARLPASKIPLESKSSVVIYNKGRMLGDKYKVVPMENKGLEVSAYLRYIVDNYEVLPDVVFFCQGAIHDHVFDMSRHSIFEKYIDLGEAVCSETWTVGQVDSGFERGRLRFWNGELADAGMNVEEFFRDYVDDDPAIDLRVGYRIYSAAIFSVRRELIQSRSVEYYRRLLEMPALNYLRPEVAHFFERSWYYIFNCHKFNVA